MEGAFIFSLILLPVAVEIGVIMLVYLNQALSKREEKLEQNNQSLSLTDLREVIVEGALLRIRPIMMTATAIIVGLLPIMLGSGTGSEVMRRIAAPMVGGMISATLLTLIVIPSVYLLWKTQNIT